MFECFHLDLSYQFYDAIVSLEVIKSLGSYEEQAKLSHKSHEF